MTFRNDLEGIDDMKKSREAGNAEYGAFGKRMIKKNVKNLTLIGRKI